jgi:hypothetical protein
MSRTVALVPVELHGAFRHGGGVATLKVDRRGYGLRVDRPEPVPMAVTQKLTGELVARLEEHLGYPLPPAYRGFLMETNGATPTRPGVHPDFGFVVDQPFFGLARPDPHQDLSYATQWFGDRLTGDLLAIGYVQGGLLAVKVAGADTGSVWYFDDDDYRDRDGYDAPYISANLLLRCADDFEACRNALTVAPGYLLDRAAEAVS